MKSKSDYAALLAISLAGSMKMPQHRHQQCPKNNSHFHGNMRIMNNGDDTETMGSTNQDENMTNVSDSEKIYPAAPMRLSQ